MPPMPFLKTFQRCMAAFCSLAVFAGLFVAFTPLSWALESCTTDADCPTGWYCEIVRQLDQAGECKCTIFCDTLSPTEALNKLGEQQNLGSTGITSTPKVTDLVFKYINFALPYLALAAFVAFVYAGFLYVTAYGEAEQVEKAKTMMVWAVIGLVLVIASFTIVSFLVGSAGSPGLLQQINQ